MIDIAARFLLLLAAVYGATLALYFGLGILVEWLNERNPERRIQKGRRGELRKSIEIRQSLISIFVTSLLVSFGISAQIEGLAPVPWPLSWWSVVPLFFLTMVLFDAWFYFMHRLLHSKLLYRFHAGHHRSVAPSPWSNDSIGVVDTLVSQGFYAVVVFVLPIPPLVLLANRLFDHINGTFGHAGFEYFASPTTRYPSPMLCTTYHDQHHSRFRYNYANYFSIWDRLLGTIAPDYDRLVQDASQTSEPLRLRPAPSPAAPAVTDGRGAGSRRGMTGPD